MGNTKPANSEEPLGIGLAYLVIGYLVMKVPDLVQSMMSGTPNLGNSITAGGMAHNAMATARGAVGGAVTGARVASTVAPSTIRAVAAGAGAIGSVGKGLASNLSRASSQAKAQGGSIGTQALHTVGNFAGIETKQATGAVQKGANTLKNGTISAVNTAVDTAKNVGHRIGRGFENTIVVPAKNSYNAGNTRRADEIRMGGETIAKGGEKWYAAKSKIQASYRSTIAKAANYWNNTKNYFHF